MLSAKSCFYATFEAPRLSGLWRTLRSQWGRVEDEAAESMTPRKPDALNTQGGLLSRPKPTMRTQLLLVCALCFVQLLVLAALGGGATAARLLEQRVDTALEGTQVSALAVFSTVNPLQEAACVACSTHTHGTAGWHVALRAQCAAEQQWVQDAKVPTPRC